MTETQTPALAWFEIPVTDLMKAKAFYETVTGMTLTEQQMGPNTTWLFPMDERKIGGHLYEGKPAATGVGPTLHLTIDGTVEEALERVAAAGGTAVSPVIDIPAGRFAYCTDPDGNSLGIFQG